MPIPPALDRRAALDGLRATLAATHRAASPDAFVLVESDVVRTGLAALDTALGGGFPRGVIATLEGAPSSGRSAVAARLLAAATADGGLAALVEIADGPDGRFYPPALVAAGVDLARLLVITVPDAAGAARAADIVLRAAAFGVVVMPSVSLRTTAWTRLASLTHRANAVLVTLGGEASHELRYFASLRVRLQVASARFTGTSGLFCALAGTEIEAAILKHKRAAPGKRARFACTTFERAGAPLLGPVRTHEVLVPAERVARTRLARAQ